MTRDEKVLFAFSALLILVIFIWRKPLVEAIDIPAVDQVGMSQTELNTSVTRGPSYLTYNTPYAFSPPVGNFLPSVTAGQVGQTVNRPTNFEPDEAMPIYYN